ncbi:nucleoside diphosphate kinase 3 isoform X2 [Pteropus alecto]|uniref:nucleoside diphosphate kinase 3 isoform X2 n=1 Tax=Pteropus alecto TaxID=9402 RepID=UPI000D53A9AE|nr:nucleoside diphosphate kinase 3 isoform X2 [Pteropus alecto]
MASCLLGCGVKKADNVVNLALWIDLSELGGHRRGCRRASGPHSAGVLGWAWKTGTASLHRLRSPSPNPPCRIHRGSRNRQPKTKEGGGGGRAADPLNTGPAPALLPVSLRSARAAAAMICLLLTIFANLFPAALPSVHERTFLAVKPDGVQRRLVGEIVRRFERKGFKLVALKLLQVWQGLDVVRVSRALIGATDPVDAPPGTIRGDFCIEVGKNVIHGSDSVESARREIALWFRPDELLCWEDSTEHWLYE